MHKAPERKTARLWPVQELLHARPRRKTPEEAVAAWNALPRALKWTLEAPKEPGLYWLKAYGERIGTPRLVEIGDFDIEAAPTLTACQWAGPLRAPEDMQP